MSDVTRAPAEPESADGTDSTPTTDAPDTGSRRWMKWAKGLGATAIGLLVTAWLLPAMTRQWDDRQKEHDLKAGIVTDMSTSTARALVAAESIWSAKKPSSRKQVEDDWTLSALEMDSRLRSYFPDSSLAAGWELYAWAVDRFLDGHAVSMSVALQNAVQTGHLAPEVARSAADLLVESTSTVGNVPSFGVDSNAATFGTDTKSLDTLKNVMLADDMKRAQGLLTVDGHPHSYYWSALERSLLSLEQAVADQALHAHASGFSTSFGDLVHDLMP